MLLTLSSQIAYAGKVWIVAAISFRDGERYYFLTRNANEVVLIPAFILEKNGK